MVNGIISFEDWSKLDLRVGEIVEVEDIEGADKLYKMVIDIGSEKRTVCAGIKHYYSKEELMNKKVILFVNLAPRKMRGIESQGMILAAVSTLKSTSDDESVVRLIKPKLKVDNGDKIEFKRA